MARRAASVFLNVPYDDAYEPFFIGLIAAVVSVGRAPRCVLELPERGTGRLSRLIRHIKACSLSLHDLSRVGGPARFNMPFELGLAVAARGPGPTHHYMLLERKPYRLDKTLSDIKGRDPLIYDASVKRLIASVANALQPAGGGTLDTTAVYRVYRDLRVAAPRLKRKHTATTLFTGAVFRDLVTAATIVAEDHGLLNAHPRGSSRRRASSRA